MRLRTILLLLAAASKAREGRHHNHDRAPGPLELPASTRYGILLGVWIANFLSVSRHRLVIFALPAKPVLLSLTARL